MIEQNSIVLVTGGAGYVGAALVPRLLKEGYRVKVLDLYIYGTEILQAHRGSHLEEINGDIRDRDLLERVLPGCDTVIHLASISNDPSFDLNPNLSRAINYDAFKPLVKISKASGVGRFIYASTSSVYGISKADNVDETHPLLPITDYSKYKALCEPILLKEQSSGFTTVAVRPATVCGYSPRQRFDLTVNILTNLAINQRYITVFGGQQKRANIHINDVVRLYVELLKHPKGRIAGKIFNAGCENHTVGEIAQIVKAIVQQEIPSLGDLKIETTTSNDLRSYHISSKKIQDELGFLPQNSIEDAVRDLCRAFEAGCFKDSMYNNIYYNVRRMQEVHLL